jgi:hypothetical protein
MPLVLELSLYDVAHSNLFLFKILLLASQSFTWTMIKYRAHNPVLLSTGIFLGIKTEIMSVAALDVYAGLGGGRLIIIGGGVEGLSTTAGSFILTIGTCFTISSEL